MSLPEQSEIALLHEEIDRLRDFILTFGMTKEEYAFFLEIPSYVMRAIRERP